MSGLSRKQNSPAWLGNWFFGWNLVAAGIIILAVGYGARYSFAVFFPALLDQFGWPRDLGASILSTHLIFYGLTAPVAGHLVDRLGPRRTMIIGTSLLAAGISLSGLAQTPWQFYLTFGLTAGVGLCLIASCPMTVLLRNWFERRRGTALAMLFVGEGAAYACYPAAVTLIENYGWRGGYVIIGLGLAAILLPMIIWVMIPKPEDIGLTSDGGPGRKADPLQAGADVMPYCGPDWSVATAVRSFRFYMICFAAFSVWGVSHHVAVAHQVALAIDAGFERMTASAVIAVGGPIFCLGSFIGLVSDRIGREWTMTAGAVIASAGLVLLVHLENPSQIWILYTYTVLLNLGYGMSIPALAASATDIFKGPSSGSTIGFIWFTFAMGGAIGPWLGGFLYEFTGGYGPALYAAAGFLLAGCLATWLAAPRKSRIPVTQ